MVYFIEAVGIDLVKIGTSTQVKKRLYDMNKASPVKLRLIKILEGGSAEELELHTRWKDCRIRGEWFDLSLLRSEIEALMVIEHLHIILTPQGWRTAAVVRCPECGMSRKVHARSDKSNTERLCLLCKKRLRAKLGGSAMKGLKKSKESIAKRVKTLKRNTEARWKEVDRPIARLNAVCVDCEKRLPVLKKEKYSDSKRLPKGVHSTRRCQPCGMKAKWMDEEFLKKMRDRDLRRWGETSQGS